jgi:hypothetical protein
MLGHQYVSGDHELILLPDSFEFVLEDGVCVGSRQERKSVITTEGDEVEQPAFWIRTRPEGMTDQCSHVCEDVGVVTVTYTDIFVPTLASQGWAPKETRCNCGADFLVSHPCRKERVKDGAPGFVC